MAKLSKKQKQLAEKLEAGKNYSIEEAVSLISEFASKKFSESLDVAVNLGIDARKSDQAVRGSTILPNGTGKDVRVAVFAQGENAEKAKKAGADIVGFDDLAETIQAGNMDFDVLIATPDAMRVVGKLGQVLGPRGLMPNPKVGTVTPDVESAVKNAKAGQVRYRTDKNGIVHGGIGKVGFDAPAVKGNLEALLADLKKAKPAASKGVYIKKVVLSSTMGPGLLIDQSSLAV
ncbi:MAG: 50S ribosomal protein L1 [Gammaproteobacteria bacterium]|jgi:large subunit ribosomal protein L1|nr:50S ribosomal protein L1 [Gammaproteobacteria bacterium]MBT4256911.1 50S ribosomal protein L1 [Gammaproteobacteria bacterium]MBT4581168.1 50S ribosomal protein L1 [Gammaproteobacteria bacterium]MBT4892315.1 50S ribosomal protein L1 [Gammaproteobacteria bacterium]MBT5172702.1 50S ribosomal protein L1 [Gammaproteobacteria bacterium]